ncbi:hypothetical protein [Micromonospora sp. MA102]|uniref:hypothetical protein n=1 Tax=Micromonospora sp. MA102 TaxID=2952755 RepID=UPI0021C8E4EE|nr:hypothetical protein [Micromonospora sp. MA102]
MVTAELPDRLRRLAESLQVPRTLTTAAVRNRLGDPCQVEPATGQVWQAEWDNVSQLVLLLSAEGRHWQVVPVSVEPTGEDEQSLLVSPDCTTLPVEVTAWAGLTTSIPTGTLSRAIDNWSANITAWCADTLAGTIRTPPPGTRRGRPAVDPSDSSIAVRASLSDDLEVLGAAPLVPVQTAQAVNLKSAAARAGLPAVITALGLPQPTVMKIVQGKQQVTRQQAEVLAQLLGYAADEIMATTGGLPADLAVELEQPRWRTVWRSIARRLGVSEDVARLRAGTGTFAMAFRQTGGAAPDWRRRIGQWLAASETETSGAEHGE